MTDMTAFIQAPSVVGVAPVYTQCTATDKFAASLGSKYLLHYKNGATPTGILKGTDQTSAAQAPPAAVLSGGWADAQFSASMGATSELLVYMDNPLRFRDGQGFVNLSHGTPTTLSLAIIKTA